ncbi:MULTISPECIES: ribosome biogenesis GTP-binding protein YihA/YsxC [Paraburkholderia]|uniref:Probable GTP-binding protein EngB n=1 Tax=Paraburkholderia tropica TaxID=92647 RepID=A0A1A5X5X3_9BURK|nr:MULTISPECIES: ribosome biogenesis GTP-binding protein YihA/YsxC [Paraburkholderia]MBB2982628.1 GTP-binding protein [Paraburkholderia tropica]MBB3003654.1 GTP-binding protein [Paraburkholderia tropica]MBB6323014.1 GTP-binding protein [Paraburkholderia tropica]OBR48961.1 YihA family ribosome biogenesis GTP-binding protein [Paraburkholderia tropica]QNB12449.1 YihA family ribosome biogenesis GTP-binding protein [Paraburkholderia tropica]
MAFLLHQARFFTTVNHLRDLPATARPEVAFAGRSNAGKSTAINLLCNQKRLAFASKTPGRTQHINYFSVGPADEPSGYLVDLPGYGYAEVPEAAKQHWQHLLSVYLQTRAQLSGLVLMMDARRPLTELDRRMIEWFAPTGKPIHALLTKCDKLTRQESVLALRSTNKAFDEYRQQGYQGKLSAQLFSALKRVGLDEAHAVIESWIVPPDNAAEAGETAPKAGA